jgi:hypothetical protein
MGPKMSDFDVLYRVLNPEGKPLTTGHCPLGTAKWCVDFVLEPLEDHAKYSVATYRKSEVLVNKMVLVSQNSCEDFCKQVVERFS